MAKDMWSNTGQKFPPLDVSDCVLFIDHLQNDWASPQGKGSDIVYKYLQKYNVIPNIQRVVAACRKAGVPIIYHNETWRPGYPELSVSRNGYVIGSARYFGVQDLGVCIQGTWGAQIIDEVKPEPGDFIIDNPKVDPFTCTDFEAILRNLGRNVIIECGLATHLGVEMLARNASERDYGVVVLYDCTDRSLDDFSEAVFKNIFPMYGRVATSDEIIAELQTQ